MLGSCVDVGGGCFKVQTLTACPSTLQTCAAGTNACSCPAGACTPGATSTSCASATSVVACTLDVLNGCGIYRSTSATACGAHQACTGAAPSAACSCVVDPFCSAGAGTSCNTANTGTIACAVDTDSCTFQSPATLCATPKTCSGAAPSSSCSCPALAASPVTGGGCSTVGAGACETGNTNMLLTCTASGGCNSWQQTTSCSGANLVCGTRSGTAACECGANTSTTFYADPISGSAAGAMPFPSGLQTPAQCRFRTLTTALTVANAAVVSGGTATVLATGATSLATATFNAESFPLVVQPNVSVGTTDGVPAPGNYIVAFNAGAAAAFTLHDQSSLTGFIIQQVSGGPSSGITLSCPNTPVGPVRINASQVLARPVAAGTALSFGIMSQSSCSLTLTNVDLRNAGQAGLQVNPSVVSAVTTVTGGTFDGNQVGAQLNRGVVQLTNLTVRNSTNEGLLLQPNGGEVVFTQTGGALENNVREGLRVNLGTGATAASTVTISGTEVRNNGANGGQGARPGIAIQNRLATLTNVSVHDNVGGGLQVVSSGAGLAPSVDASGSRFDTNGSAGISAVAGSGVTVGSQGTFTASLTSFNGNRGAGVHVGQGGSATIHGGTSNGNGAGGASYNGLEIEGQGSLVVDRGAAVQNNVNSGVRTTGSNGNVTLGGTAALPLDLGRNGLGSAGGLGSGAWFANTTVTATNVNFHDNGRHGVQVNNVGGNPIGSPISLTNSTFINNALEGLRVEVSERTPASTNSLNVSGCSFTGSVRGIDVVSTGNVWAAFQGNTVSGNSDTGIFVTGTGASNLSFVGNTVTNNRVTTPLGGFAAGGMVFTGTNPPVGRFSFTGNLVHHNLQNQILVAALGNAATWDLNGTATAACVSSTANTLGCYNNVPMPSSFVGIVTVGATVLANGNAWQNATPVNGTDFAASGGGSFLPAPPIANCAASPIACP